MKQFQIELEKVACQWLTHILVQNIFATTAPPLAEATHNAVNP